MFLLKSLLLLDFSLINLMHPRKTLKLFSRLSKSPLVLLQPAFQNLVHNVPRHESSASARLPRLVKETKSSPMCLALHHICSFLASISDLIRVGKKLQVLHVTPKIKCNSSGRIWLVQSIPLSLYWLIFLFLLVLASASQTFICICQSLAVYNLTCLEVEFEILHFLLVYTLGSKALGPYLILPCFDQLAF